MIQELSDEEMVHLRIWSCLLILIALAGKRKASLADSMDSPQDRKRPREDSEPVEDEEGPGTLQPRSSFHFHT